MDNLSANKLKLEQALAVRRKRNTSSFDFYITQKRLNEAKTSIQSVMVHEVSPVSGFWMLAGEWTSKSEVHKLIGDGKIFYTQAWENGEFEDGSRVRAISGGWLRTDANDTPEDNLGELPEG